MTAENLITDTEDALRELASTLTEVREGECLLCYVYRMLEFGCTGFRWAGRYRDVRAPRATGLERRLGTTPERMVQYWAMSAMGGVLSGTIGVQGHYANGLAAVYMACGQAVGCVAESAVGVTRYAIADEGALYASVTLPNLIVGTVGGLSVG